MQHNLIKRRIIVTGSHHDYFCTKILRRISRSSLIFNDAVPGSKFHNSAWSIIVIHWDAVVRLNSLDDAETYQKIFGNPLNPLVNRHVPINIAIKWVIFNNIFSHLLKHHSVETIFHQLLHNHIYTYIHTYVISLLYPNSWINIPQNKRPPFSTHPHFWIRRRSDVVQVPHGVGDDLRWALIILKSRKEDLRRPR